MAARHFTLRGPRQGNISKLASGLIVAALILLFLYVGRAILEPLVIAGLLAFIWRRSSASYETGGCGAPRRSS